MCLNGSRCPTKGSFMPQQIQRKRKCAENSCGALVYASTFKTNIDQPKYMPCFCDIHLHKAEASITKVVDARWFAGRLVSQKLCANVERNSLECVRVCKKYILFI